MPTIQTILQLERECRTGDRWLQYIGPVVADDGSVVQLVIKSHGFYNQRLTVNGSVDYQSGHTINNVKQMHAHIRDTINNYRLARMPV